MTTVNEERLVAAELLRESRRRTDCEVTAPSRYCCSYHEGFLDGIYAIQDYERRP